MNASVFGTLVYRSPIHVTYVLKWPKVVYISPIHVTYVLKLPKANKSNTQFKYASL